MTYLLFSWKVLIRLSPTLFLAIFWISLSPNLAESKTSSQADKQAFVEELIGELVTKLPKELANQGIHFTRVTLDNLNEQLIPSAICAGNVNLAEWQKGNKLVLSQKLVSWALEEGISSANIDCSHKTPSEIIQGAIIHVLAHRFDDKFNVSDSAKFKGVAGGQKSTFRSSGGHRIANMNLRRSPNAHEFKNLKEAFATNLEYYVLDENYVCLKPAFASFYDRYFSLRKRKKCSDHSFVLLHSKHVQDNLLKTVDISAEKVYQVHFLHAAEGPSFSSRWGHSMFRLVMCSPDRTTLGPDCLDDTSYDVVLSYRAGVSGQSVSYWSGITGKYPSQLFAFSFAEVLRDYTRMEFRPLKSIPLNLSRSELEEFLDLSLERYWNYKGQYFFFTNHCGSEAARHLKSISPDKSQTLKSRNPRRLFSSIEKSLLNASSDLLDQFKTEKKSRLYFPSKKKTYSDAFDFLSQHQNFTYSSLQHFINHADDANRMFIYNSILDQNESPKAKKRLIANLLLLERLRFHFEMQRNWDSSSKSLTEFTSPTVKSSIEKLRRLMSVGQDGVKSHSYGIPSKFEIDNFIASRKSELLRLSKKLKNENEEEEFSAIVTLVENEYSFQEFLLDQLSKI